jgi:sec-independent protein translocase protein TatB
MSFSDTIFLFFLALILFGPKKLPEMARKAGLLMAQLRRASNEFRSQIETEIAHLEVDKSKTTTTPVTPPQGTVASMSLNPVSSQVEPHDSRDSLAGPAATSGKPASVGLENQAIEPAASDGSSSVADPTPLPSRESHV